MAVEKRVCAEHPARVTCLSAGGSAWLVYLQSTSQCGDCPSVPMALTARLGTGKKQWLLGLGDVPKPYHNSETVERMRVVRASGLAAETNDV